MDEEPLLDEEHNTLEQEPLQDVKHDIINQELVPINKKHVYLSIKNQHGEEMKFAVNRTKTFHKLLNVYCENMSLEPTSVRFVFEGRRIGNNETPNDLEMNDGDQIDVMQEQLGGTGNSKIES